MRCFDSRRYARRAIIESRKQTRADMKEYVMRFVFLATFVLLVAIAIIFALQNLRPVTVSLLGMTIHTRVAVLAVAIYLLGVVSGGSLLALVRRSYAGASEVMTRRVP